MYGKNCSHLVSESPTATFILLCAFKDNAGKQKDKNSDQGQTKNDIRFDIDLIVMAHFITRLINI